jgi:hypothetical protein
VEVAFGRIVERIDGPPGTPRQKVPVDLERERRGVVTELRLDV